ncbi:hypothetical protein [Streptomyces beigongshangae]|uniref:hypothetical protein n=1 Tax=Streptomyces beigongshangae TaxID=2841597 RepID=UPI001C851EDB|nr:hypothetical protein [Streptomyces sp. REN17]
MESTDRPGPVGGLSAGPEPDGTAAPEDPSTPPQTAPAASGPGIAPPVGPLGDFVVDPAARAELARRTAEIAELLDEAGDALGGILAEMQREARREVQREARRKA